MLRDPMTLFFMFFPPLVEMIAFGYALDNDVKHMAMVVLNEDRTVESRQLHRRFVNTETFRVVGEVQTSKSWRARSARATPTSACRFRRISRAICAPAIRAQVQMLIDGSNSTTALQAFNTALGVALTQSVERCCAKPAAAACPIEIRPQMLYNPTMRSPNFFIPGVIGVVLQIGTTFATAMAVVRERERGTLEQLLVSPLSRWGLMLGKLVPYLCIGMTMAMMLFVIMRFLFHVPIAGSVIAMLFATLGLRVRLAEPRSARRDQSGKPDAGVANVDGLHAAERLLFRLHFPARDDAVDFLRARLAPPDDLFHCTDARDHSARRDLLRILAGT